MAALPSPDTGSSTRRPASEQPDVPVGGEAKSWPGAAGTRCPTGSGPVVSRGYGAGLSFFHGRPPFASAVPGATVVYHWAYQ